MMNMNKIKFLISVLDDAQEAICDECNFDCAGCSNMDLVLRIQEAKSILSSGAQVYSTPEDNGLIIYL